MTNEQFAKWMADMGYTPPEAAAALGLHRNTVMNYARGTQAGSKKPAPVPRYIELACAQLTAMRVLT